MDAGNKQRTTAYKWQPPVRPQEHQRTLRIFNSFTRRKEPFVANERNTIKWYCCGPTVYDVAHLGHARCYITFDIVRRIMAGYFGYHVFYVMNITDIDDKIIKRARSNYLCDKFINETLDRLAAASALADKQQLIDQLDEFVCKFRERRADELDKDKLTMIEAVVQRSKSALADLAATLLNDTNFNPDHTRQALERLRDIIADEQDARLAHTVNEHQVFKDLTLNFEQEYHDDMQRLDVLPPNALTRVSEFIDEIGAFIAKLEHNGFAYRSGGSVYFDTEKFDSDEKHSYAKLVREAYGQKKDLDEGEGELSVGHGDKKKSPNDFALWKKSKVGEPSWTTQDFEPGRPGWHIECSVMASKLLGENFDIHSGGHDLRFPHHDNEIAQAEAYYNTGKDWVNYFIHSGHLTISGCKMSKSLKNFITIRQALQEYSSRQLRFAFLAHGWTETLDYSPNTMNTALSYEKTFKEFFLNTADILRRKLNDDSKKQSGARMCDQLKKWSEEDHRLNDEFLKTINKVDAALCDNFDTRTSLNVMSALVKECNKRQNVDVVLIMDIENYIKRILSIFGAKFDEINLRPHAMAGNETPTKDDQVHSMKYIETLAKFRADVRKMCKSGDTQQCIKQILNLCDELRDRTLPELGVRLEDRESGDVPYAVKIVDSETLARERALVEKRDQEKKLKEETQRLEQLRLQQQREEKAKLPPGEMFKRQVDKYSAFDSKGIPTHDSAGKEISKSALKKLQRLYAEQEARYKKYLESLK
jgi:cysteinyl-tRNA synthetase